MRCLKILVLFLTLCGSLLLVACGGQGTSVRCFGPRPVSSVHAAGSNIIFTMTTIQGTFTYSVPKTAFGGVPATMKNGDLVYVCSEPGGAGGQKNTTTITEFGDQGQPAATSTP